MAQYITESWLIVCRYGLQYCSFDMHVYRAAFPAWIMGVSYHGWHYDLGAFLMTHDVDSQHPRIVFFPVYLSNGVANMYKLSVIVIDKPIGLGGTSFIPLDQYLCHIYEPYITTIKDLK